MPDVAYRTTEIGTPETRLTIRWGTTSGERWGTGFGERCRPREVYVDGGVSGAKDSRRARNGIMADGLGGKLDVVAV